MKLDGLMLTKTKFTKIVTEIVRDTNLSHIDAIIKFCEENKMEPEDIKKYLTEPIRNKIESEARVLNYLPRQNTLPFD